MILHTIGIFRRLKYTSTFWEIMLCYRYYLGAYKEEQKKKLSHLENGDRRMDSEEFALDHSYLAWEKKKLL